ncbi:ATP-binding protein [Methylobacterium sp. NEAU 140]|uniref:ATP-binding protein n=1 Tax=Methylobacterium sp. NEAU 140 TaxID=3064945 RepID=UPI0027329A20|nr:ATP-binding protein [Methylobacterium sp. NEAU 140]MDP4026278.1 ATP-binding protein [Methylobacterium sp. NEAU 140]
MRGAHAVYDEQFHEGVNVIRGENSSGKSTVLNFIYYGIGGDLTAWSEVALLCSHVIVEVELNGIRATLRREVSAQAGVAMEIFGGSFDDGLKAPRDAWKRYPYRRSPSQESFSQALFRLLGLPEVLNELSGNITIHQILRLLYADQLSPVDDLFRFERFDQAALRDTIGRLLCGAYANNLYDNEQRIKLLTRELDEVLSEIKGLFTILGSNNIVPTYEWVTAEISNLKSDLRTMNDKIELAEKEVFISEGNDQLTLAEQNKNYVEVQNLQKQILIERAKFDKLQFDIADSAIFIKTLENKIEALRDAAITADHFGDVKFHTCPACYAVVGEQDINSAHACHLCKSPFDFDLVRERIAGIINENAIQIKQSQVLQARRLENAEALRVKSEDLEAQWRHASARLSQLQRLPSSAARQKLRELHRQVGYVERQIEDLDRQAGLISVIGSLTEQRDKLNGEIGSLRTENEGLVLAQRNRLSRAYTLIAEKIKVLLTQDLRRQDSFEDPKAVNFTFADNKIVVDGQSYFSASSRAILKSCFCLGFLEAAASDPGFRHPRFVMIDTLENMGVEAIRSQNLQIQIARISAGLKVQHQIIFATAMLEPELDDEQFTVGRYSTRDEPTLAIVP